jgi:group I intron endonuclease
MKIGIYKITNQHNEKLYVGSSVSIQKRWNEHKRKLNDGKHDNPHLQQAWNKYGESCFQFEIIELCTKDILLQREQFWIDFYQSAISGYNINPIAQFPPNWKGKKRSEETKKRMSIAQKGHPSKLKGIPRTEEVKRKVSASKLGKPHPISYHPPASEETKKKLSIARRKRIITEETKQKISQSNMGRIVSGETREKISNALIGKPLSDAHKLNISMGHKRRKSNGTSLLCICI